MTYSNWAWKQPNDNPEEERVFLLRRDGYAWHDAPGNLMETLEDVCYICECHV